MSLDLEALKQWIGRSETRVDQVTPGPLQALAAVLDRDDAAPEGGAVVPPFWHWLYFLPLDRQSQLGADGHALRGGFLPPVPLPRRMWAGSQIEWHQPLRVGQAVTRTRRIVAVSSKLGRTGPLVFVRVRHEVGTPTGPSVIEEQDIVYREAPRLGEASATVSPAPTTRHWEREIRPDAMLLFRYSALTFNAHRIHYDRRYATEVEGYPGLVVHGPLIATLLLDLLQRHMPDAEVLRFTFRALKPTFDVAPFAVCGIRGEDQRTVRLWAQHADGTLAMDASVMLVEP